MGLVPRFTKSDILNELEKGKLQIERGIICTFQYVGEGFVHDARLHLNISGAFPKGKYKDHTANLRSSIGYFVLKDGEILKENMYGNAEGEAAAKQALQGVQKGGYQLVCVAGMDYASYVESKGYNVITSQADVALVNVEKLLKKFRDRMAAKGVDVGFDIDDLVTTMFR